jgi:hypothetical protein
LLWGETGGVGATDHPPVFASRHRAQGVCHGPELPTKSSVSFEIGVIEFGSSGRST